MSKFKLWFSRWGWIVLVGLGIVICATILCLIFKFNLFTWIATHKNKLITILVFIILILITGLSVWLRYRAEK